MASNGQTHSFVERKSWPELLEMANQCEQLFSRIKEGVDSEKVLPSMALGIIQHQLNHMTNHMTDHVTIAKMLEARLQQIRNKELNVLVAGEVSAGKSTFMNILIGDKYLPVKWKETTKVMCELRHDPTVRRATIQFIDSLEESIALPLPECYSAKEWDSLRECIETKEYNSKMVERVVIEWPLASVKELFSKEPPIAKACEPEGMPTQPERKPFDPEFLARMDTLYARSFDGQEPRHGDPDIHQTVRKRPFTAEDVANSPDPDQTDLKRPVTPDGENTDAQEEHALPALEEGNSLGPDSRTDTSCARNNLTASQVGASDIVSSGGDSRNYNQSREGTASGGGHGHCTTENRNAADSFRITLLDCPGIKDKDQVERFEPVLANAASCRAFIFIIDSGKPEPVEERRLQSLMEEIEAVLHIEEIELNPDCCLFVINKIDIPPKDELEDLKQQIICKLREKWPLINENHVISMKAQTVLDEMTAGKLEARDSVYELMGRFLRYAARITMEEHCLWMLNFLQTAHAFASTGKRWAGLAESRKRMDEKLRQTHANASDLYDNIFAQTEDDINTKALKCLQEIISETADSENVWNTNDIEREIQHDKIAWPDIARQIDRMIVDKINKKNGTNVKELKLQYKKDVDNIFKKYEKELARLEDTLHGIVPKTSDNQAVQGFISVLLPVALGGAIRVAPLVAPFMLLAAPLLPVPLLLASVAGEIQYYNNETKREEFKRDKAAFLRNRMRDICVRVTRVRQDSEIFIYIFGESKRAELLKRIHELMEIIRFLLNSSVQETQEHRQTCCLYIIQTIDVYAKHVMDHVIHSSDLDWTQRADGVRKPIGGGGQANVYEATLKDNSGGKIVAVKEFHCSLDTSKNDETLSYLLQAYREYFTLRQLSRKHSENLVKFLGTSLYYDDDAISFRIVLERCLGNLNMLIEGKVCKGDSKPGFLHHAAECTAGISFLHENNIVHRDIKPENFLIREKLSDSLYRVVVCDMGCSKLSYQICTTANKIGTVAYWAPEVRGPFAVHTKASDMYSLGLVLWELAFSRHIPERFSGTAPTQRREMPKDKDMKKVLSHCLSTDPAGREPAAVLLEFLEKCRRQD